MTRVLCDNMKGLAADICIRCPSGFPAPTVVGRRPPNPFKMFAQNDPTHANMLTLTDLPLIVHQL